MGRDAMEAGGLHAVLAGLERQRRQALRRLATTLLGLVAGAPLLAAPLLLLAWLGAPHPSGSLAAALAGHLTPWMAASQGWLPFAAMAWLGGGLLGGALALRRFGLQPRWDYLDAYKRRVFTVVCRERFPGIDYAPDGGIGWRVFDGSGLFAFESDVYQSEDHFTGRWGETAVCFAEAFAKREVRRFRRGRLRTEYQEYFRGIVFAADFHKHFHSRTRLVPHGARLRPERDEERTELEDPAFEGLFDVWTTDSVDARYVLSTSTMARLTALARRFPGMRARLADEQLLLLLPSPRRFFEPSLLARAASPAQIEGFAQDVESCLDVVDALNLNTRIWSKR